MTIVDLPSSLTTSIVLTEWANRLQQRPPIVGCSRDTPEQFGSKIARPFEGWDVQRFATCRWKACDDTTAGEVR